MAMKFDSQCKVSFVFLAALALAGCATTLPSQSDKVEKASLSVSKQANKIEENHFQQDNDKVKKMVLLDTSLYLPKRLVDKEAGAILAYQPAENPYLLNKKKIDSADILSFVNARQKFHIGELEKSRELIKGLTAKSKHLSGPWVLLGDISKTEKDFAMAEKQYRKAIEINKYNVNAYIRLAIIQRQQGKFVEAQNTYVGALSIWSDFPEAHLNLSILYDIYLNDALKAQRHLEAYQFLTFGKDKRRRSWLKEIQKRTGQSVLLKVETIKASSRTKT